MGCVSRAFEPQSRITLVSSISRYELVPPPAPNTVARPATLGACQVRLQLSTLLQPTTTRANFCARKLSSFVVLEQLNRPNALGPPASIAARIPVAARSSASSQVAGRSSAPSRTNGRVMRVKLCLICLREPASLASRAAPAAGIGAGAGLARLTSPAQNADDSLGRSSRLDGGDAAAGNTK